MNKHPFYSLGQKNLEARLRKVIILLIIKPRRDISEGDRY